MFKILPYTFGNCQISCAESQLDDFNSFLVDFKSGNCPSPRCSSADDVICKNIGIFNGKSVSINDLLHFDIFTK